MKRFAPPVGCILLAAIALAMGCGDDGAMTTDSSVPPDTGALPDSGASPDGAIPPNDLATLTPCPTGWQEVRGEGQPTVCEPWPAGGRLACDRYSAQFPGEATCVAIGTPCPAGDFEEGLATDGTVIFVRPGAAGGDGTAGSPFGTIDEGLAAAGPGTTVALAKGSYDGAITVPAAVTLRGACVSETHLTFAAGTDSDYVVYLSETGAALENVSVDGGDTDAVYGEWGTETRVQDLVIEGPGGGDGWGLETQSSQFTARNVVIRGFNVAFAYYLEEAGQRIQVERMVIEDSATAVYGTLLHREATLHFEDLAVHGMTLSNIELDHDLGNTEIERSIVEDGVWTGLSVGNGGVLTMTDAVIRDIESDENGWDGAGIAAYYTNISRTDPGIVLRRVLIDRVRDAGIAAFSSIIDAEQLVVRGVRRQACTDTCVELVGATAIAAEDDGQITVADFFVADVEGCGVNIGTTGEMDLTGGDVQRATVGACVRGDEFDVNRLTDGVRYHDNMTMLDATSLPVPAVDGAGNPG